MPRTIRERAERALGVSLAAALLARPMLSQGRPIRMPHRTLAERLAALPLRDLPVERPVTIRWNAHQVPFIEAESEGDLAAALGLVHMHLRATQIEVLRRIATGRVAEMVGPIGVGIDHAIRTIGLGRAVPGIIAMQPERSRRWVESFLRGFNAHLAAAEPAPEWAALGLVREPWTPTDFFTMARLLSADLTWPVLRRLLRLRDTLPPAEWARLWPQILHGGAPDLPPTDGDGTTALFGAAIRAGVGSNAAALAGTRTASGRGIVSGDPHLGLGLPNAWLACCLHAPGISAAGLMLPGLPFLALGRNRDIAWGGTSLHAASTDFVDLSGLPETAFDTRTESVRVRGGKARRVAIRSTAWGPVVSDTTLFPSRTPLAMRWVGHRPSDELTAMLGLLTARNREDFRGSLRGFAIPGQTMVYAGPDGVGRQNAAHLPRRPPGDPADLVVERGPADAAWEALADGEALFGEWDPAHGVIASANERLVGAPPASIPVGLFFGAGERVSRIRTLLAPERGMLDAAAMRDLVLDVRQPSALAIRDLLVDRLPLHVLARHAGLVAALRGWDGSYDAGSTGALAYELLLGETARRLLGPTELAQFEMVWTTRALVADRLRRSDQRALAVAVAAALPLAARRFRRLGQWGRAHVHRPQHPLGALPGPLGRPFRQAAFPGAGGNDTLNKTGHALLRGRHRVTFGATARYLFDLADEDANEVVLFGGQDGWLGSSTAADQLALWRRGEGMRLPLRPETARATFPHVTVLRPD